MQKLKLFNHGYLGPILVILGLLCCFPQLRAAQKKVLFYGPTFQTDGVAAAMIVANPSEFFAIGSGSAVWTPGDPVASKDWSKKTTADFQAFDAIVIGDLNQNDVPVGVWTGAIANRDIWSAAITGNVFIYGGDPEQHAANPNGPIGAIEIIQQGIRFAVAAGHGAFITLGEIDPNAPSPVHPLLPAAQDLLGGLGQFSLTRGFADAERKLYSHSVIDCISEADLSNWLNSSHEGWLSFPATYLPVAIVTDVSPEKRTPSSYLPSGESGLVNALAKGSFKQFYLTPRQVGKLNGTQVTITAKYISETGSGISGASLSFSITGPNASQSATKTTDSSGTATWTYTGTGGGGRDIVLAKVTSSGQTCPPSAQGFVDWGINIFTITATDSVAAEPTTQGGAANTGTFTVTRTGSTSTDLIVSIRLDGTARAAFPSTDYTVPNLDTSSGNAMTFVPIAAGQSSATLVVTPVFDTLSEVTETVVASIPQDTLGVYATGSPFEATVNISSATTDTVTITVDPSETADETGNNPAIMQLHRTGTVGDALVTLAFTGTASFGLDYLMGGLEPDGRARIPAGSQNLDLLIDPIPDSRYEGSETITITIQPALDGSYAVGTPSAQTVSIVDDETSNQIPANGWAVTDLGTFGGSGGYGNDINTVAIGNGQYRGQVGGYFPLVGGGGSRGIFWDNGASSTRYAPSGWTGPHLYVSVHGINNAATLVGFAQDYDANFGEAVFWNVNQTYATILPHLSAGSLLNGAFGISQRDYIHDTGGIIMGTEVTANGNTHAVFWSPNADETYSTSPTDLQDLGNGTRSCNASAINQSGEVVGSSQVQSTTVFHAFRTRFSANFIPQTLIPELDDMGTGTFADGNTSGASDINDLGELVGSSQFPGNLSAAAYKAPDTGKNMGWANLGVLGQGTSNAGTSSAALGISYSGLIVGWSYFKVNNVQVQHAFVISNQGNPGSQPMLDLNEQSWALNGTQWQTATANGWVLQRANKINDANWIVGYGTKSGATHAFVLSPAASPH